MTKHTLQTYFLLAVLAGALVLSYFIFEPFLNALALAAVAAVVLTPLHRYILRLTGNREMIAALLAVTLIIVFVLTPLVLIGIQIFHEAQGLYTTFSQKSTQDAFMGVVTNIAGNLEKWFPTLSPSSFSVDINQYAEQALKFVVQKLGLVFSSLAHIAVSSLIFLITLYYFFKDGARLVRALVALSPLPDTDDEEIVRKLGTALNSSVKGSLTVGVIQGALSAAGFAFFGVPNPVLWGSVAAVSALIPGIGTALVLLPAIIFLFASGHVLPAFGLLIWSVTAVGLIDNFLGPKLAGRGMEMPPLVVFLSVLGGIMFFGPLGFLLGPIVLNLLFALLEIYSRIVKSSAH